MTKRIKVQPSVGHVLDHLHQTVADAREAYGDISQIVIVMEELCELASAASKFVRYPTSAEAVMATKEKVMSEMADVTVVFETLMQIYEVDSRQLYEIVDEKLTRVDRWISKGPDPVITTVDRSLQ